MNMINRIIGLAQAARIREMIIRWKQSLRNRCVCGREALRLEAEIRKHLQDQAVDNLKLSHLREARHGR